MFTAGFNLGFGSLVWVYASESFPSRLRSIGASAMLTADLVAVLHARLDRLSGQRPPLDTEYRPPPSFLSEVFDMFNPLDPMAGFPQLFNRRQRPQLRQYCGIADD